MLAGVVAVRLEPHHEVSARMNRRQSRHLHRIENAEYVELSLLGKVGGVGEDCERDVHDLKVAAPRLPRLAFVDD